MPTEDADPSRSFLGPRTEVAPEFMAPPRPMEPSELLEVEGAQPDELLPARSHAAEPVLMPVPRAQ